MKKNIPGIIAFILIALIIVFLRNRSVIGPPHAGGPGAVQTADGLLIYDGEMATLGQDCLSYGSETSPGKDGSGNALKMTPDAYHAPGLAVNCAGQDRLDLSSYSYLEFYIKGSQDTGNHDFNIVSYYGQSNTVNLLNYVDGGKIDDTWRLVSIPMSALKTSTYNLGAVDTLYFGTDDQNRVFYVDSIIARNAKTIVAPAPAPTPVVTSSDVINLYDGSSSASACVEYAEEGGSYGKDGTGLKLLPDAYHSPNFKVNCDGTGRMDLSSYSAIEFYLKADSADSNDPLFHAMSYFGESNSVNLKKYISGGVIDTTWRLVSIPISDLKTSNYDLSTVDNFYFGSDSNNRPLYLDNLVVTKKKTETSSTPITATTTVPTAPVTQTPIDPYNPTPAPIAQAPLPTTPTSIDLYDTDEVDLVHMSGQWAYPENKDYASLNFSEKYDTNAVINLDNYSITSKDDSNYSSAKQPTAVGYRWRTTYAPTIRTTDLQVVYRVFLKLPVQLQNGKTYTITSSNLGITTKPLSFTFSDSNLNQNIKVNQVGYLPTAQKIGYVGQYMGTAGPMPFSISTFEVRDASTKAVVMTGTPKPRNVDGNNTGEQVYDLDFSSLKTPGSYYVRVPGVGISYSFRIGADIYNEVADNAIRGAYQQRASTALSPDITRFTHGPAHMDDAYVMNHNPIPDWFISRFGQKDYYPTTMSGQKVDANKGHYDAGDYGKYVINGSLFVGNILSAFEAFPNNLQKDDMQIPESGNGIPDLIDEVKWELDWLENMQDPNDGGVFCIVKPDGAVEYYENRMPDAPSPSKRLLYAKDTTCTGAYAAALAKAGQNPLIKKFYPTEAARYVKKAQLAWTFLSKTPGYLGWHHYGVKDEFDTDKSMDERVWAAIELYGATGSKTYLDFFLAHAKPEYERWGWETLFEASGQADYACAFETQPGMDAAMKSRCQAEIIKAADSHVTDAQNRAYRLSMSDAPLNYRDFTYFFPQERIIQLLIANSLKPNTAYTKTALSNWDYILGANPTGYSFITGIGSKRFREVVSTQSEYDGIKDPVPGLPIGMGNNFGWLDVYGSKLAQMYPANATYPLLKQVYDGFNIGVEFTVPEISENIVSAAYFATVNDPKNVPPSAISIAATPSTGAAPLSVTFTASATDPDGKIVRYHWDFDDESFSNQQNPTHVFKDPYKLYRVFLTVTDNDGAEKYQEYDIRTSPATFAYDANEYIKDANTLALFHLNTSLNDEVNGYTLTKQGNTKLTSNNVQWMKTPSGQSLEFNSVDDTAYVDLPQDKIFPASDSTLVVEAKIYVDSYLSLNTKSSNIFTLTQNDNKMLGLFDAIYVDGTHITSMANYDNQKIILTKDELAALMAAGKMQTGTWYNLKFVIGGGKVVVYANNDKIVESTIVPDFSQSSTPIRLSLGGFKGYIDEVRVKNAL